MIIKIDREKLIEPLKNIVGVSEKKQTMPILGNVLLTTRTGALRLVASDLEVEISTDVDFKSDDEINTTLPSRKFLDILKSLPGSDEVVIDIGDNKATIKSGKSRFVLATLPGSDFPYQENETAYDYKVSAEMLDTLISQTAFSMAVQDARHFLNGLFFEVTDSRITVVATDGHRLSMSACDQSNSGDKISSIIPRLSLIHI